MQNSVLKFFSSKEWKQKLQIQNLQGFVKNMSREPNIEFKDNIMNFLGKCMWISNKILSDFHAKPFKYFLKIPAKFKCEIFF